MENLKKQLKKIPKKPGVYLFKNSRGKILYIGKANNLRNRVRSHFLKTSPLSWTKGELLKKIEKIDWQELNSEIEALILEATLIKKHQPKYNILLRDDKDYFYVGITKEDFPRLFITHQPRSDKGGKTTYLGIFTDGRALKAALRTLRRIFPYRTCRTLPKRPCLESHLGRCPAPCLKGRLFDKKSYEENIKNLVKILKGKRRFLAKYLKKKMEKAAKKEEFEQAACLRNQAANLENVFAHRKLLLSLPKRKTSREVLRQLKNILNLPKIPLRIEAYDISNIQGKFATGSMISFKNGEPEKEMYRRFRIRTAPLPNDVAMLEEVAKRRLRHQKEWPLPNLFLVDGGKAQLNTFYKVLVQNRLKIPVIALAKRKEEIYNRVTGGKTILFEVFPEKAALLLQRIRNESHRFAIAYHKKLREKSLKP